MHAGRVELLAVVRHVLVGVRAASISGASCCSAAISSRLAVSIGSSILRSAPSRSVLPNRLFGARFVSLKAAALGERFAAPFFLAFFAGISPPDADQSFLMVLGGVNSRFSWLPSTGSIGGFSK